MNVISPTCDLCGLTLRFGQVTLKVQGKTYRFCCMGCRQVFMMLTEAADSGDPENFKETELYKKCKQMGIIPNSEEALRQMAPDTASAGDTAATSPSFAGDKQNPNR